MRVLIVLVLLLAVAPAHAGKYRTITCKGKILFGTNDSGIYGLTNECGWLTKSAIGARIFKVCQVDDDCEVTGVVDENDWFVRVSRVRMVDTSSEPPVDVIKESACKSCLLDTNNCELSTNSILINIVDLQKTFINGSLVLSYVVDLSYRKSAKEKIHVYNVKFNLTRRGDVWVCE